MLTPIVVKILQLLESFLDYFVSVNVTFWHEPGSQWTGHTHSALTDKGIDVLDAVVTIIHHGLDFVAQMVLLFPMQAGDNLNTYP